MIYPLIASLLFFAATDKAQRSTEPAPALVLHAACGELRIDAMSSKAVRVRCGPVIDTTTPELIYTNPGVKAHVTIGENRSSSWLQTQDMIVLVDRASGHLRFLDKERRLLTEETLRSLALPLANELPTTKANSTAEAHFALQAGEHLYGSGQFQDGFLDIARLPRHLIQVNTQIALPFFLSSNGYAILWHNYGLTELNLPPNVLRLDESGSGRSTSVEVTTSAGTQRQERQSKQFSGEFFAPQDGDYSLTLDSGRTMTDRYSLTIDGKVLMEFTNFWLPGSTSTIAHLSAGSHTVLVNGNSKDLPVLRWGVTQNQTTLMSTDAKQIDYTVFVGKADQIIGTYRALTGDAPLLPKWAFGFIQCRERYHSSEEILSTVQRFRQEQLPLDLIVQDWQYWGKYGWNAMRFDERFYPDPAKLVEEIHKEHAHLMVSVWSRFDPDSEVGKKFLDLKYFIPGTTWVDFFNPSAASLYWHEFSTRMRSLGIDAWWLDATEPENDDLRGRSTFAGPADEYRLTYPLFVTKTVYEGSRQDAPDRRPMILTRSAFLGEQRYGVATWSGDIGNGWDTLQRQVTAGLDYSVAGLPYWTTDTGGFFRPGKEQYSDPAYHERFLRWLEYSVFTPLMRVHGYQSDTEPWNYGADMVVQVRQQLDLRSQLLPYIYSQAGAVTLKGGTLMRPLVVDFPEDEKALTQKYEYMFGPALLVTPVLTPGGATQEVYAPATPGGWYDFWTAKPVGSGTDVSMKTPIDRIPVLVRAGSIVTLSGTEQYVGDNKAPVIDVRIYPGADGEAILYDDDGLSFKYEQGRRASVQLLWNDSRRTLIVGSGLGNTLEWKRNSAFASSLCHFLLNRVRRLFTMGSIAKCISSLCTAFRPSSGAITYLADLILIRWRHVRP